MAYIVVYQGDDGSSRLEDCADLNAAAEAAERLRNVDSVERPRIFKTEEVKFDFRPYYRVEVTESESSEIASTNVTPTNVAPTPDSGDDTASIDPWASAEPPTVHSDVPDGVDEISVSTDSATETVEEAVSESVNVDVDADDDGSVSSTGLFSGGNIPDPPEFASPDQLAEEVADVVPPRRGLFGR